VSAGLSCEGIGWDADGRRIVSDVAFSVRAGEFVALVGRNGAGKSTLLDIAAGLRRAHRGEVRLDGRTLSNWEPRALARVVSHLPQAIQPDLPFAAEELVLMGRYPHTDRWFESPADHAAVDRAMTRTGCTHLRGRRVRTLSGGERQRVLLAACLAQAPSLLLFDEPSTHLDVDQQLHCFALLREECEQGAAVVAVTHDLNLALAHATRLLVLSDGVLVLDTPVHEAARSPEWLRFFSPRLSMTATPQGAPWVWYA
jgi:iron complex transport system ATP-binding protein